MADSADKLTAKQHKAIASLMSSATVTKAAESAGVGERTLYTWLDDPVFSAAYRAARREAVQQATARLQQYSSDAVGRLLHLLTCGTSAVQLGAARSIIEFAIKAVDLEDIAARLAALEKAYAEKL